MSNILQVSEWLPPFLAPFVTLSYPAVPPADPDSFRDSLYYATGVLDACLVLTCIAIMSVLREVTRIYVMEPFARWKLNRDWERSQREKIKVNGTLQDPAVTDGMAHYKHREDAPPTMSKRDARKIHRSVSRFAEQGWSLVYYTANFTFGVYVHYHLPTRMLDPADLWLNYPHIPLAGPVKFYYLTQIAFYIHQMFILHIEARRKDHARMLAHHVISVILMVGSYVCNLTRIGCVMMVLMDCADVLIPIVKMLRYLALYTLCDAMFVVFLAAWIITRHVLFVIAIKSFMVDPVRLVPEAWAPARGRYLSSGVHKTISLLLVLLQVIHIIWFVMLCRIAYRVVTGGGASDDRSDDEDDKVHRE